MTYFVLHASLLNTPSSLQFLKNPVGVTSDKKAGP